MGNDAAQKAHDYLYWEFTEQAGKQAVRRGDWKGIRLNVAEFPDGPLELYNLSEDPGEARNRASEFPAVVAELAGLMKEAHVDSTLFPLQKK